jgi:hypothetical protein
MLSESNLGIIKKIPFACDSRSATCAFWSSNRPTPIVITTNSRNGVSMATSDTAQSDTRLTTIRGPAGQCTPTRAIMLATAISKP